MHTFINYLKVIFMWLVVILFVLLVLASVIIPIIVHNFQMLYVHVFLVLMFIMCLGVLRIYNGIFHNTRMIIELSKLVQKLTTELPGLRKVTTDSTRMNTQVLNQLRETLKGLKENNIKIDLLNDEIKKWRQANYGNSSRNTGSTIKSGK